MVDLMRSISKLSQRPSHQRGLWPTIATWQTTTPCQPLQSNPPLGTTSIPTDATGQSTSHTLTRSAQSGKRWTMLKATWWSGEWHQVANRSDGWESMPTRPSMLLILLLSCWSELLDSWPLTLYNSHIQNKLTWQPPLRTCSTSPLPYRQTARKLRLQCSAPHVAASRHSAVNVLGQTLLLRVRSSTAVSLVLLQSNQATSAPRLCEML